MLSAADLNHLVEIIEKKPGLFGDVARRFGEINNAGITDGFVPKSRRLSNASLVFAQESASLVAESLWQSNTTHLQLLVLFATTRWGSNEF